MMISQAAEYSLRAALCLAARPESSLTTRQIARYASIPMGYLSKVLSTLARAGIVESQRGIKGGFVLKVAPDRLTLMEIIQAVDVSHRIPSCPLNVPQHKNRLCPLHRRLDAAAAAAEEPLRATTLSQLLSESVDGLFGGECRCNGQCHAAGEW